MNLPNIIEIEGIKLVKPTIHFPEYKTLIEQAKQIASEINAMEEVTDENVKETKKVLAKVNKSIKALNDKRMRIKNEILEPYEIFNTQIKEIEGIVKSADEVVRQKVRDLEERERESKKEELREIWDLRIGQYELSKIFEFDDWLTPQHLNKSMSVSKAEEDMTAFLEQAERDLEILKGMTDSDDLILEYKECKELGVAITIVNQKKEMKKELEETIKERVPDAFTFRVFGEKDRKLVEYLLKENCINFEEL